MIRRAASSILLTFGLTAIVGAATPRPAPLRAPAVVTGEIEGAKFTLVRPVFWNRGVLLLAHGLRDESAPLVADLNPAHLAYHTLVEEGWIVAKTSYRRNGLIIRDAVADLVNLRAFVSKTYGEPQRVILEGDSMGGAIVTLIAEQFPEGFNGAVAVDAALQVRERGDPLAFNLQPQLPLVFLSTQDEVAAPRRYLVAPLERTVRPVLLTVAREGHVNVNQRERLAAIRALVSLIERRSVDLPRADGGPGFYDATQPVVPVTSQVRLLNEGGFEARVVEVTAGFGNLLINVQPSDMVVADIAPGSWFELAAKDRTYRVLYGRDFTSVKRGEWVAFPNADGFFCVARNHDNAAATAGLKESDPLVIRRLAEQPGAGSPSSAP